MTEIKFEIVIQGGEFGGEYMRLVVRVDGKACDVGSPLYEKNASDFYKKWGSRIQRMIDLENKD